MKSIAAKKKTFLAQPSVLKRIGAFIIDMAIINMVILFPFRKIFDSIVPGNTFSEAYNFLMSPESGMILTFIMISVAFMAILYFMLLEKKLGQTPGKMIFKLYVIGQEKDLKNWQLFVRSMFFMPLFPFVLLWIIDPIVMLFTKENQRLSEILSRTKVVEQYSL